MILVAICLLASCLLGYGWMILKLRKLRRETDFMAALRNFVARFALPLFILNFLLGALVSRNLDHAQYWTASNIGYFLLLIFSLTQLVFAGLFITRLFVAEDTKSYQQLFRRFEK